MSLSEIVWMSVLVTIASIQLLVIYALLVAQAIWSALTALFVFLFQNWIIQAAFAGWLAFALQQVHQKAMRRRELFQRRYDQKLDAVQAFFRLVDKRTYATRAYLATLRAPSDDWQAERQRYREVVKEWNESAPSLLVTMLTLLPARLCFELERATFVSFSSMDRLLSKIRHAREAGQQSSVSSNQVQQYMDELAETSSVLLAEFLNLARAEQRRLDERPTVSAENADDLSFGYLFVSLFKPTVNR